MEKIKKNKKNKSPNKLRPSAKNRNQEWINDEFKAAGYSKPFAQGRADIIDSRPGWTSGLVLHLKEKNNMGINCQLWCSLHMIYQTSQFREDRVLRTSNLLDLLGRVIHELCPSALVFLHAGHGFGVFGSLGDVFGFDRVHCNDPGRSIWLQ